jgi:hypothetical protein
MKLWKRGKPAAPADPVLERFDAFVASLGYVDPATDRRECEHRGCEKACTCRIYLEVAECGHAGLCACRIYVGS